MCAMPLTTSDQNSLFSFKISLKYSKPHVWRRVYVPVDYTFEELHHVIQAVMEWDNVHLHVFRFKHPVSGMKVEIGGVGVLEEDPDDIRCCLPESVKLDLHFKSPKQKIEYEYDFVCSYEHAILFEKIVAANKNEKYPKCVAGQEMPPPEDDPDGKREQNFDLRRINFSNCRQFGEEAKSKEEGSVSEKSSSSTSVDKPTVTKRSNEPPAKKKRIGSD